MSSRTTRRAARGTNMMIEATTPTRIESSTLTKKAVNPVKSTSAASNRVARTA